jgi:hypothetical protein
MTGGGFPTMAEVAAEGRSSARRFPARRRSKLGLNSGEGENGGEVAPVEVRPR